MIKGINKINKNKEVKTFKLDNWNDLKELDFEQIIPKGAKSVELTCKKNFDKVIILTIDYVTYWRSENLSKNGEK